MPLLFTHIVALFVALDDISLHDPRYLPTILYKKNLNALQSWLRAHRQYFVSIQNEGTGGSARPESDPQVITDIISTLLPSSRPDRVYNLQPSRLTQVLKRCLALGYQRHRELDQWKTPCVVRGAWQPGPAPRRSEALDLGSCVEKVLRQAENPLPLLVQRVRHEEVERGLDNIARTCRFSGPGVRSLGKQLGQDTQSHNTPLLWNRNEVELLDHTTEKLLTIIYSRLQSQEAKWLTRLILKDLGVVGSTLLSLKDILLRELHPMLPMAMMVHDDVHISVRQALKSYRATDKMHTLCPIVGVKVASPKWAKAQGGLKHAVALIKGRAMAIEQKFDGEYCQIHVDLDSTSPVRVFSKSGKESTTDRKAIIPHVLASLSHINRNGETGGKAIRRCILEGEMVVCDLRTANILPFHKIRKHVTRADTALGTAMDSAPHEWEGLMVMIFDILLIDDTPILHQGYSFRRAFLSRTIRSIPGRIGIVPWRQATFANATGLQELRMCLGEALAENWEGLVLKPIMEPYFPTLGGLGDGASRFIKLKRDCIAGLGDTADFAVIGGGYCARRAQALDLPSLQWTHFYIACPLNRGAAQQPCSIPEFQVIDCIHSCISTADIIAINRKGYLVTMDPNETDELPFKILPLAIDSRLPKLRSVFRKPLVFEITGSRFDIGPNRRIYTLRHPRVTKIHWDRTWQDCIDLAQLQSLGRAATERPTHQIRYDLQAIFDELERSEAVKPKQMSSTSEHTIETTSTMSLTGVTQLARLTTASRSNSEGDVMCNSSSPIRTLCQAPLSDRYDLINQRMPQQRSVQRKRIEKTAGFDEVTCPPFHKKPMWSNSTEQDTQTSASYKSGSSDTSQPILQSVAKEQTCRLTGPTTPATLFARASQPRANYFKSRAQSSLLVGPQNPSRKRMSTYIMVVDTSYLDRFRMKAPTQAARDYHEIVILKLHPHTNMKSTCVPWQTGQDVIPHLNDDTDSETRHILLINARDPVATAGTIYHIIQGHRPDIHAPFEIPIWDQRVFAQAPLEEQTIGEFVDSLFLWCLQDRTKSKGDKAKETNSLECFYHGRINSGGNPGCQDLQQLARRGTCSITWRTGITDRIPTMTAPRTNSTKPP